MQVLIVEDNRMALLILQNMLTAAGYRVRTATNGREALGILQEGKCRMVISDWEMPEMDGIELCHAIRADGQSRYVYVILLTAHNRPNEKVLGLTAGADDFVTKPYNPAELLARVHVAERVLALETRDIAIFAMAKLAESRDSETGAHLERVRSYCRVLSEHLAGQEKFRTQVTAEYMRLIYQTSPLHDIGKVGIPDSVLLKPGRLSDREYEIMKEHTTIGAQTLDAALTQFPEASFLEMARDIAATHHERWDGTGYPSRLKGEGIPLCGRIVSLADVYDALTTRRVYKDAFSHEVARGIILEDSGTHFDPDVVKAFIDGEPQFIAIREQFSDHATASVAAAA